MNTNENTRELSLDDLANVVGGANVVQTVINAYNAELKNIADADAAAQTKELWRSYGPMGSTPHI